MALKAVLTSIMLTATAAASAHAEEPTFRDILRGTLNEAIPGIDADRVIYELPSDLMTERFDPANSARANVAATDARFTKFSPLDLYRLGKKQPQQSISSASINAKLAATPIALVLVPGYLSEFAGTQFAEEAFAQESLLAANWAAKLRQHESDDVARDTYFSLGEGDFVQASLGSVVSVASIDAAGAPLIRLVAFRFPQDQTLESVGTIEEISALYRRRLQKTMQLLGEELDNLVFVGHSRGAAVALDMLAKGRMEQAPWLHKVRAVVSYGGIISGSRTADRVDTAGSLEQQNVAANRELESSLRSGSRLNPFVLIANMRAYMRFKGKSDAIKKETTTRLDLAFDPSDVHEPKYSGLDAIMDKLGEELNQSGGGSKAHKLKIFIARTIAGLEGLRTEERLSWWRTNTLPTAGVKYYALPSTMTDPRRSAEDRDLVERSPVIVHDSDDYKMGLKAYRSMLLEPETASFRYDQSQALNDGNVTVQRTIFWPKLIASLNPANELHTEILGVLSANHFALAHAQANDSSPANPLPRVAVLKAIAAKVAWDLN